MKNTNSIVSALLVITIILAACGQHSENKQTKPVTTTVQKDTTSGQPPPIADNATIMQRREVPVLCYHHIREWKSTDSKRSHDYIVPPDNFRAQMKMLADSGYHTISPDQLYDYLAFGKSLPEKPVIITYDDTDEEQFSIGKTEMDRYGFKGIYFIMTISLNKPRYMTSEQVRQLAQEGHSIGSHTWDHKDVRHYTDDDWAVEIDKPTQLLETLSGRPVRYFAYPFGAWDTAAAAGIRAKGFRAAFQLSARRDEQAPLFTIRRIIIPGSWSAAVLLKVMHNSFH
jgi:peptidoglycan/xylan/chitin deacetylase (PgdA/CDA1 family)